MKVWLGIDTCGAVVDLKRSRSPSSVVDESLFLTSGRGSDAMQPMAIPSVGGMGVQLITFLLAPCLYCLVKEWQFKHDLLDPPTPEETAVPEPAPAPQPGGSSPG